MKRPIWMAVSHYSVLIFLAILCLAPLWVIFATSFRQQVDIFAEPLNFIFMPTLENYRAVIADDKLDRYLANSLFVGIVSTAITLVLGCMAAYGLARFRFPGRHAVAYTTLLLRTVPLAVLAIPVFLIWNEWNMVNSLWGMILLYVAVNLPFTIWLLYGFVLQVPIELEEAAAIDGCGPFKIFTKVLLPLMAPGLAAASIFTFSCFGNSFLASGLGASSAASVFNALSSFSSGFGPSFLASGLGASSAASIFTSFDSCFEISFLASGVGASLAASIFTGKVPESTSMRTSFTTTAFGGQVRLSVFAALPESSSGPESAVRVASPPAAASFVLGSLALA